MKKNEFMQMKGLDLKELRLKVKTLREEIANLTLDKNMKKLKDLKAIYKKKKELAQVLTVIRQKELLAQLESQGEIARLVFDESKRATPPTATQLQAGRNDKRKRSKKV